MLTSRCRYNGDRSDPASSGGPSFFWKIDDPVYDSSVAGTCQYFPDLDGNGRADLHSITPYCLCVSLTPTMAAMTTPTTGILSRARTRASPILLCMGQIGGRWFVCSRRRPRLERQLPVLGRRWRQGQRVALSRWKVLLATDRQGEKGDMRQQNRRYVVREVRFAARVRRAGRQDVFQNLTAERRRWVVSLPCFGVREINVTKTAL